MPALPATLVRPVLARPPLMTRRAIHGVTVEAAGRLHLGFLDPSATLGRRFGSLGLMLGETGTLLDMRAADTQQVHWLADQAVDQVERVHRLIERLQRATGHTTGLDVTVRRTVAPHTGLGSGTQLALAVGRAFSALHDLDLSTPQLADMLDRGARSGIGVAGFDLGGMLVDGGPRSGSVSPPVLARHDFPASWRIVLVDDPRCTGLHGEAERAAIARLPAFPQTLSATLCHHVLMQVLPGLAEADFPPFAHGVSAVQQTIGEYFASVQGGVYTSPAVGSLMDWIAGNFTAAVGQSSWGPTAFAILPSQAAAEAVVAAARQAGTLDAALHTRIVGGRNHGARVGALPPDAHRATRYDA